MRHHQITRHYVQRRTAQAAGKREIIRCLKRCIARGVFNNLPRTTVVEPTLKVVRAAA